MAAASMSTETRDPRGSGIATVAPARRGTSLVTVAVMVASVAAVVAGATLWLLFTSPVAVADAVETGNVTPLVTQLAAALYEALLGLLSYF